MTHAVGYYGEQHHMQLFTARCSNSTIPAAGLANASLRESVARGCSVVNARHAALNPYYRRWDFFQTSSFADGEPRELIYDVLTRVADTVRFSPPPPPPPGPSLFEQLDSLIDDHLSSRDARFDCFNILGEGGYSVVWNCTRKATGELVALKQINRTRLETNQRRLESQVNEIAIQKKLNSSMVLRLDEVVSYDFNSTRCLGLVLPLLAGGDAEDWVEHNEHNGLSPSQTIDGTRLIFGRLVAAVDYLHGIDIAHRDIKPENIMLASAATGGLAEATLIDFGFAVNVTPPAPPVDQKIGTDGYCTWHQKCITRALRRNTVGGRTMPRRATSILWARHSMLCSHTKCHGIS